MFESMCRSIRSAHADLGHSLGWSFLYTPKESFRPNQQLLFVGLNPAGNAYSEDYECEEGNAYLCDDWGSGAGKASQSQS